MKKITFETAFNIYTTELMLGHGGSGIVYAVTDTSNQPFALKCLNPDNVNSERLKRFKNEIFFCEKNAHRNIITVVDSGFYKIGDAKCPFYVMPRYDKTLRNLMNKGIPTNQVLSYFTQILDGVEAAHLKNVWHRDLKPENILFDSNNNCLIITDFGIAHFSEEELKTLVETERNSRLANFQYAAPEQKSKGGQTGHRADIFALGLILNELFTQKVLGGTNWKKIENVASDFTYLDPIVDKMCSQDPSDRYQSIDEVKADIEVSNKKHIVRQRLGKISGEVVPLPEANDLFISNPVKVTSIDYQNGALEIQLNQAINGEWLGAFNSFPCAGSLLNYERERFDFHGDKAVIRLMSHFNESTVQVIVNQFKTWLTQTTNHLKSLREQSTKREQREELARLEKKKNEEERRLNIISNTKI